MITVTYSDRNGFLSDLAHLHSCWDRPANNIRYMCYGVVIAALSWGR